MIVYTCDQCGATLADGAPYITVTIYEDDGDDWDATDHHLCDRACLSTWAVAAELAEHTR